MKHLFIINPVAGRGESLRYKDEIIEIFKDKQEEFFIEITQSSGHATEIAREYSNKDVFRIYAIGGDGTINEVLNGMVGSKSSLAVIPCGTGNDFSRTLIGKDSSKNILKRTIEGYEKDIDIARVNNKYFINISSVGLDSQVVYNARLFKKKPLIPNGLSYIFSLFYTPFTFRSIDMKITIDDISFHQKSLLIAVSNGKCYGGGVYITPEANIEDGLLDICLIRKTALLKLLKFLPKAIKGKHGSAEEVSFFKGKKVTVESKESFILNVDGELEKTYKSEFEIIPMGIKLAIPKGNSLLNSSCENKEEVLQV